jgi:hypothetical protein
MRSVNCGPLTFSHDDTKLTTFPRSQRLPDLGPPLTLDVSEVLRMSVAPDHNAAILRDRPQIIHLGPAGMLGVYLNNAICLSPDAKLLFVGIPFDASGEPMTQVWDVAGPTPSLAMKCHTAAVAPDAGRAVTARYRMSSRWDPGSYDNSDVTVFDLPSPTPRLDFKETGVHVGTISPDGKLLALPSHRWGVTGSTRLSRDLVSAYASLGFTLNGFSQSLEIHEVRLYNATTGRFLRALPLRKVRENPLVEFSPDSRTLVVRYFAPTYVNLGYHAVNSDWSVELWDVPAGLSDGWSSGTLLILASAAALVLAGAAFDWRRGG